MDDLVNVRIDIFTIGQYLRSSPRNLPVSKFYHPREFDLLSAIAHKNKIPLTFAGPLVRSSYMAKEVFETSKNN